VLTLAADNLPITEPALVGGNQVGGGKATGNTVAANVLGTVTATPAVKLSDSDDTGEAAQFTAVPEEIRRGLDVDDVLRRLNIYERTPETDADGPTSHNRAPASPVPSAQALALFWEAPGDALSGPSRDVPLLGEEFASLPLLRTAPDASGGYVAAQHSPQLAGVVCPEPMTQTTHGESDGAAACVSIAEGPACLAAAHGGQRGLALQAPRPEWNESVAGVYAAQPVDLVKPFDPNDCLPIELLLFLVVERFVLDVLAPDAGDEFRGPGCGS
jgi:hypothetical protein